MLSALTREQGSIEDEDEEEEDMISESKYNKHTTNTQEHSASTPQTGRQEPPAATNLSRRVLSHIMPNFSNWMKKSLYPKKKPMEETEESQESHEYHESQEFAETMKKSLYPKKRQMEESQESQESHEYQESQEFAKTNDHLFLDNGSDVMSEFSNGKGKFSMSKDDMLDCTQPPTMGWALCTTNSHKDKNSGLRTVYKHCIGCYKCPNCVFREQPRQRQKGKRAGCPPLPSFHKQCPQCCDGTKIQHEDCDVSIQWKETQTCWKGSFSGTHSHSRPPHKGKLPDTVAKDFAKVVMAASEATPKQLKMGTRTRDSVTTLHATFGNSSKLAYERGKVLKGTKPGSSMSEILSFLAQIEKVEEAEYLKSSSFSPADAHLTFQNPEMVAIINAAYHPLQSDSVEGFIEDLKWNKDVTITITSTYDEILKKSIVVCITIMFGKSAKHYHQHFMVVLKSYDREDKIKNKIKWYIFHSLQS
jgi:hypothetical protein